MVLKKKKKTLGSRVVKAIQPTGAVNLTPKEPMAKTEPEAPPAPPPITPPPPTQDPRLSILTDATTGKPSGIIRPDGSIIGNLTPDEVRHISASLQKSTALPEGTVLQKDVAAASRAEKQGLELAQGVGVIDPATGQNLEGTPLDVRQTALAAGTGLVPGALGGLGTGIAATAVGSAAAGATTGAAAGGFVTPAALILAAGGATLGLTAGIISNMGKQHSGTVTAQLSILTDGKRDLGRLITLADNAQTFNEQQKYVDLYNQRQAQMYVAYKQNKLDTQSDVFKATSDDGTVSQQKFYNFFEGGGKQYYDNALQQALINPQADIQALIATAEEEDE